MKDNKDKKPEEKVERKVFEVRRTTYKPTTTSTKFVFELKDSEWTIHFEQNSNYTLSEMQEILEVMRKMPKDSFNI